MRRTMKVRGWYEGKMLPPQDLSQNGAYWTWLGKVDADLEQFTGLHDKNARRFMRGIF